MKKKKKGISRLLEIAGERKGLLIISSIFSILSAALMLIPYVNVYFILRELLNSGFDISLIDMDFLLKQGYMAFIALLLGLATLYISVIASHVAAFNILYSIRMKLVKKIGELPLGYLSNTSIGAVKKTLEQNVEKIELFVAHQIPDIVNVVATAVFMVVALFYLSAPLAIASITAFIIGMAIQGSLWFGKKADILVKKYHDSLEEINASAVQYVRGIQIIKIFGKTAHSFKNFYKDVMAYRDFSVQFTDQFEKGFVAFKVLVGSFFTFMLPIGILILSGSNENTAFALTFLFFIVVAPGAATPMFKLALLTSSTKDIDEGVERIDEIFSQKSIPNSDDPKIPYTYNIAFKDVSFSYDNKEPALEKNLAIHHINFEAKAGEVTALVGPSGSGKSTVASLIPRFWDIKKGVITIGGMDIKRIPNNHLMDIMSFVFQDSFLFTDTILENIRAGNLKATREEVIEAAKASQCHEFIMALPKGYDTVIGKDGTYLSGGEEQRICIARAILKNAPILVLDEATAFADPENEYKIQRALKELIKNKTVIIIAHRLSSIKNSDQIIVMNGGEISGKGTHNQLLENNIQYAAMWNAYMGASDWKLRREA